TTEVVKMNASTNKVTVSVEVLVDSGWTLNTPSPVLMVFQTQQAAQMAPLYPVPAGCIPMANTSGNTYQAQNVQVQVSPKGTGKVNNWIVIWTSATSVDGQYFEIQRLPAVGNYYGWTVEFGQSFQASSGDAFLNQSAD